MTFTTTPDFPVEERSAPRIRRADLSNYIQQRPNGINLYADTWPLTFSAKSDADRDTILAYFEARNGVTPFQWTTPFGETAQFTCSEWDTSLDYCGLSTITATFTNIYVPGATNLPQVSSPVGAFTWIPEFSASRKYNTRPSTVRFGDGYAHNLRFGLNPQEDVWSLTFNNRTNSERNAIRTYLRGAVNLSFFTWETPLGMTAKFACQEWSTRYTAFNNNTISATFTRIFDS